VRFLFYKKKAGREVKDEPSDQELPLFFTDKPYVDNERLVYYYGGAFYWMPEQNFQAMGLPKELIGE
jgi:hypothetical protein